MILNYLVIISRSTKILNECLFYESLFGFLWKLDVVGFYFATRDDSLDWKELGTTHEINQVLNHKNLRNGSIILFHNDAKYTPQVLDTIIKGLKEKGFEIVPISELIHRGEYDIDLEGRQRLKDV